MISILVKTKLQEEIKAVISREDGLSELVQLTDQEEAHQPLSLMVNAETIRVMLNWRQGFPPYLVTDHLPYHPDNLLGLIFMQLGAFDKAALYLQDYSQIRDHLRQALLLQHGQISEIELHAENEINKLSAYDHYRRLHNQAFLLHYQGHQQEISPEFVIKTYGEALAAAPDDEYYAFTTRQLADLYLDMGRLEEAEEMVRQAWQRRLSEPTKHALQTQLIQILIRKLKPAHQKLQLAEIFVLLKESLNFYEQSQQPLELGMLSMDAAWVAQLNDHFSEGLACINRSIRLFEQEEVPELLGDAWMRKGTLLYGWAQKGQPFHQQAIDSYRQALKIFSRDTTPYVYADIHHHLALIYSEMPGPKEKKAMLNALASKSFQEALAFFTREQFPYEYGCICNNYGNALVKFPDSNFQNTTEKAIGYFEEALTVRHGEHYPYERATTLLNLLEAYWQLPVNPQQRQANQERWERMKSLVWEVESLVGEEDAVLRKQAEEHWTELEKARNSYA